MKQHARVLIIGGGVAGCGLAYHLTKLGCSDVVLVEKNELTAGATWHAAGHVMHYAPTALLSRLQKETTDLFPILEKETGQEVGFHQTGAIRLLTQPEQMVEYRRAVAKADVLGIELDIISAKEAQQHFPLMTTDNLLGAVYTPGDGHVDPSSLTYAYAKGARMGGVEINTDAIVTAMDWRGDHWEVQTKQGTIRAETVVNCAGMWAPELTAMVGVNLPLIVFMHQHIVTEDHPDVMALGKELVLLRDPAGGFNCRQERKGLLSGVYEHAPEFVFVNGIPPAFGKELMEPNFDRSADFIARLIERVPTYDKVGIKMVYNGPTSRTPDHQPLLGPLPGVPNYFIAAGYAAGIVQSGFTRRVAEWIVAGEPDIDMSELDVRRFGVHATRDFAFKVVHAGHAFSNLANYPYGERGSGRPGRRSALYGALPRAVYGVRNGWEVPNWFAPEGADAKEKLGFCRPNWFGVVGDECHHAAEKAAICDLSYTAKFEVNGPGAAQALERAFACPIPAKDGATYYGPLLTAKGTIATCMTIIRQKADSFLLLAPGEYETRDFDDLRRRLPQDGTVQARNVSGHYALMLVTGPSAPAVLAASAKSDLSVKFDDQHFAEGTARTVAIGFAPSLVIRRDQTGCGDWLVMVSMDLARTAYEHLMSAGSQFGLANIGVRAVDALRLENGIPMIGIDVDRTMTAEEAGIGHLTAPGKGKPSGRNATEARRLVMLSVDSGEVDPYLNDVVSHKGQPIALVRSGGYGYLTGRSLAFATLPAHLSEDGIALEVEIFGQRYPARVGIDRMIAAK